MSSFDENEDVNFVFVDSMMVSDEEERQNPTTKKSVVDESTGKRKRKSKWWTHFSVDEEDPTFASYSSCFKELRKVGGGPIEDDWKRVSCFLPFLRIFYDATLRLSGSRYVTCNYYAHEIYGTRLMISSIGDDDEGIKKMAA
ncbi:hypothetical protein V6N11_049207 [Hibiscus sabdariffa]|uniref:Uncharacterized protein n=1 Tax=Hibiscus sabdariffa TaxID=183260 RepID=A0ABR2NKA0_9ROSI